MCLKKVPGIILKCMGSPAILVVNSDKIGGISGLKMKLPEGSLKLLPSIGKDIGNTWHLPIVSFLAYTGIMWWSSWYPGAEPGGGGYIAQRPSDYSKAHTSYKRPAKSIVFRHIHPEPETWLDRDYSNRYQTKGC